jgi:regulator of protease activity HflC (stomatin/prohibitin superfamily)
MLFDDLVKNNPLLRKALAAGEEQVGKAFGTLLASDGLSGGLRTLAAGAAQAKETLEKGVAQALHAANLPSKDDVAALKRRLEELEEMIDGLADRVGTAPGPGSGKKTGGA